MKKSKLIIGLACVASVLLTSACAGRNFFTKPVTASVTNYVPAHVEVVTNIIVQPPQVVVVTNTVKGETVYVYQTNTAPPLIVTNTVYVQGSNSVITVTNGWESNPAFIASLNTGKELNSALNPTPTAPMINGVLGAIAALTALGAAYQTKRLNREKADHADTQGALSVATDIGKTLVENFETVRKAALEVPGYAAIDNKVMGVVKTAQALAGPEIKSGIHDLVEDHTETTKPV